MGKVRFAKTLISKQVSFQKLRAHVGGDRNLVNALAFHLAGVRPVRFNLVRDVLGLLKTAEVPFEQR